MIETPEQTMNSFYKPRTGKKLADDKFNSAVYIKMMCEIEQAVRDIRDKYISQYGKLQIMPEPSLFDIAESEDAANEEE